MRSALHSKVVVVTGGTAGVGFAAASAFRARGATTVVLSRNRERVAEAAAKLGGDGRAYGWPVDMSLPEEVRAAASRIESEIGPIAIWVNNAMTTVFGRFIDMSLEEFAKATANTYLAAVNGTHAALEHMLPRNRGTIVQVGSALAYQPVPLQSAYCGAKHAIRGFTNAVRCELMHEHSRVRLTMVQLSAFNTPQFDWARSYLDHEPRPLPPVFEPELAAEAIVRAAFHPTREYWVGWPAAKTIIGSRMLPELADRVAAKKGFEGQLGRPGAPRDGNLFESVPRKPGARGRFEDEASMRSRQWWISTHRQALILALGAGALLAGALRSLTRRR
ncbi:MAG TPA: SDR family oxidoreductase [Gammaproteobacteria bacterium]|nr:SDR family oxidoreductase [Gammaproteobacteria bacterium]